MRQTSTPTSGEDTTPRATVSCASTPATPVPHSLKRWCTRPPPRMSFAPSSLEQRRGRGTTSASATRTRCVSQSFWFVGTDQGYRTPQLLDIISFSPANRIQLLFNMDDFLDGEAYLYAYPFDLTENNNLVFYRGELYNTDADGNPTVACPNGLLPLPDLSTVSIQPFLNIQYSPPVTPRKETSLQCILKEIRQVVLGKYWCKTLSLEQNYLPYLNPRYFYNLPVVHPSPPKRRFILFPDTSSQDNGATELCSGANRVMVDMWNSVEFEEYQKDKTSALPTCLFKITKPTTYQSTLPYFSMITNYQLFIIIGKEPVLESWTIEFPPTTLPLTIREWTELVNQSFASTPVTSKDLIQEGYQTLADIVVYDWAYQEYTVPYLIDEQGVPYKPAASVHNVLFKTTNLSTYTVEFKATAPLLQFFGKPFQLMVPTHMSICSCGPMCQCTADNHCGCMAAPMTMHKSAISTRCACPKETYAGFVDGIQNDNFMNFSIVQGVSEKWVYNNLDNQDSHPLHFHLTSGYMNPEEEENRWIAKYPFQPYAYSLDSYGVPPQQTVSFYLTFLKHNSFEGQIPYLGYLYHCHFMTHHDMMMMGQYFVYPQSDSIPTSK